MTKEPQAIAMPLTFKLLAFRALLLLSFISFGQNKKAVDSIEKLPPYQDSISSFSARLKLLDDRKIPVTHTDAIATTRTTERATIISQPHSKGKPIQNIPISQSVQVYDYENGYWLISVNSIVGYVKDHQLINNAQMDDYQFELRLEELSHTYGKKSALKIINHQVWYGMTKKMARASIGEPLNIQQVTGYYGLRQRWNYKDRYLIFENDFLLFWIN